ncbi:hypothetical protein J1C73_23560, partial [Streptomyces laculatispora]|nr:hypothetical protein [Streptomyces laculatispora]
RRSRSARPRGQRASGMLRVAAAAEWQAARAPSVSPARSSRWARTASSRWLPAGRSASASASVSPARGPRPVHRRDGDGPAQFGHRLGGEAHENVVQRG